MKKILTLLMLSCVCFACYPQYTMEDKVYDYIDEYKNLAMLEMEKYGIPASITLAQAIYSSQAGTNDLVRECHNHFAIMCHTKEWKGDTYYRPGDKNRENCYRKYGSAEESYRDHSLFLSTRSRYVKLFYYPVTDYRSWANGLLEAGFSGNPKYADTLISIIEKYYLMHYDRKVAQMMGDTAALKEVQKPKPARVEAAGETSRPAESYISARPEPKRETPKEETKPRPEPKQEPAKTSEQPVVQQDKPKVQENTVSKPENQVEKLPEKVNGLNVFVLDPYAVPFKSAYYPYTSRPVYENNKTKFILARAGDTYHKLAATLQMTEKNLRLYNDVYDGSEPIEDEVVYLEMKSTKSQIPYHVLQNGDTYRYIAQRYGIQLKILIKRNSGNINSYGEGDKICIGCN